MTDHDAELEAIIAELAAAGLLTIGHDAEGRDVDADASG
jgi:hypothetical protein